MLLLASFDNFLSEVNRVFKCACSNAVRDTGPRPDVGAEYRRSQRAVGGGETEAFKAEILCAAACLGD